MLAIAALALAATVTSTAALGGDRPATRPAAEAEAPWEWRAAVGGQLDSASHGVLDLGVRSGPWSLQLFTDTLDARYEDAGDAGRWWLAARGEVGAAGLFISRWTRGAPDSSASFLAFYAGVEGGWLRYLPLGLYAGAEGSVRRWFFSGRDDTRVSVPSATWVATPAAVIGWWAPWAELYVRAGAELQDDLVGPKVWGEAKLHPSWRLAPRLELRAGWSKDQSDITRARVGGLSPYVVPLAGAGWAEWWVDRWAAVRAGPELELPWGRVAVVFDGVTSDVVDAWGLAALARAWLGALYLDAQVGWAPEITRREGASRVSVWLLAGFDWHAL